MISEAGSVDAVLEAGERLIAVLEGLGGCVVGVRPAGFLGGEFPEVGIGAVEAAQGPLAEDEVVEEEASLRGSGAVVVVILGFEPIKGLRFFPGEDVGFGVDAGLEPRLRRCRIEQTVTWVWSTAAVCCERTRLQLRPFCHWCVCPYLSMAPGRRLNIGEALGALP